MVRVAFACVCLALLAACSGNGGNSAGQEAQAAATGTTHFVNSPENARSMALRDAYVDFSFDYPARWSVTPQPIDGTARNYVRVAAPLVNGYEPYAFLVGFASGTGNAARDRASLPAATRELAASFGAGLQDYQIVSSGPGRIAGFESYGWRFTASGPGADGAPPVQIYGRGELILPPGASRGVTLVALATSRAGDVHSAAEVGRSGPLKAILDSFHLTASTATPPPAEPGAAAGRPEIGPAERDGSLAAARRSSIRAPPRTRRRSRPRRRRRRRPAAPRRRRPRRPLPTPEAGAAVAPAAAATRAAGRQRPVKAQRVSFL